MTRARRDERASELEAVDALLGLLGALDDLGPRPVDAGARAYLERAALDIGRLGGRAEGGHGGGTNPDARER